LKRFVIAISSFKKNKIITTLGGVYGPELIQVLGNQPAGNILINLVVDGSTKLLLDIV